MTFAHLDVLMETTEQLEDDTRRQQLQHTSLAEAHLLL